MQQSLKQTDLKDHLVRATLRYAIFVGVLLVSGCVEQLYGYSAAEWHTLSIEQKRHAETAFEQLIAEKNRQVYGDKIEKANEDFINRNAGQQGNLEH